MHASAAPFEVRVARPSDVQAAGEVVASAYRHDLLVSDGYLEKLRDAGARAAHGQLLVAVQDDVVLGSITWALGGTPLAQRAGTDEAELRMLGVAAVARGRGMAEALVRACIDQAGQAGAVRLLLSTQPQMHAAQRLYKRLGFSRRPDLDWVPEAGVQLLGYARDL